MSKFTTMFLLLVALIAASCVRPASMDSVDRIPVPTAPATATVSAPTATVNTVQPAVEPSPVVTLVVDATPSTPAEDIPIEVRPIEIPISGPAADPQAELSGLAWYGDYLILLPQYPGRFESQADGSLFYMEKSAILSFLDGDNPGPLQPAPLTLFAPGLETGVKGFEGFESLTFLDGQAFLTIESSPLGMMGYLISGAIEPDMSALRLDTANLTQIPPQAALPNISDEAVLILGSRILTMYEANGANVNPHPVAHLFDSQLQLKDTLVFPNIEYRITDATLPDENGRFWVINFYFPTDFYLLPAPDPLLEKFGEGRTHRNNLSIERLLELQISETGIVLSDTPPIQLELSGDMNAHNWEGIVRLDDRGFLLVTDKYPKSMLAFVPMP
jgi:hypothetical protein